MTSLNFFRKDDLKTKISLIKQDLKKIVSNVCDEPIVVLSYGVYDIKPEHLIIWITVESDKMKKWLKSNNALNVDIRKLLDIYDYPQEARDKVIIDFESQQTVDRESEGDWHLHFK
ncbi:hypothetical protein FO440_08070 [Mucilaginibacter corticis]|uniref:Uncharacterized protein n=1 Tax=Mucilaginibacter corticis TaxID=2597670 RepID=A0A556MWE0_9SPHI|nr:hypothetical protein [Mucilaginibacter corticis]TSJ44119.1 hypothetical protein FO440_08070 [Mucilaginibacter corticis]